MNKLKYIFVFFLLAGFAFAQNQINPAPDTEDKYVLYSFNGKWMPDVDATKVGPENFSRLQNFRYNSTGIEGVKGYSKINSSIVNSTYYKIRSGYQLRSNHTTKSYSIVHAENSGETASRLYANKTSIPSAGNFIAAHLWSDSTDAGIGRFAGVGSYLGDTVIYANGVDTNIWSGDEYNPSAVITIANADPWAATAYPIDETLNVTNALESTANGIKNYISLDVAAGRSIFLVMTTRPLQGVWFYIKTANGDASSMACAVWNGSSFAGVANSDDGTRPGVISLFSDGQYTFDDTKAVAKPYYFEGKFLYTYRFTLSAGTAEIYQMTCNAAFQEIKDLWDGVPRQPILVHVWRNVQSRFDTYTLEANYESYENEDYSVELDGLSANGYIELVFEDRITALNIDMLAKATNATARTMTVKYWDGDSYEAVAHSHETTSTFNRNGIIWWYVTESSGVPAEKPRGVLDKFGYAYQVTFDGAIDGTYNDSTISVGIDTITGVTAQLKIPPFKFVSSYKGRALLANYEQGGEFNRVDYSVTDAPDAWNGAESSNGGAQSLRFDENTPLVAGISLLNRMGNRIVEIWIGLKENKTYILEGDSPSGGENIEPFKIKKVSDSIGCIAPATLATASVGYEFAKDVKRNIAIWLAMSGPYMFDGASLRPIAGIDEYFDRDGVDDVDGDYIQNSVGWYDPQFKEYNLLIPFGTSQATNNLWLVYSLEHYKWSTKDTGAAAFPQCAFPVEDTTGKAYVYAGLDTGYLARLENTNAWDGEAIQAIAETGDIFPTGNPWDITEIREVKLYCKRVPEQHNVQVLYYPDTQKHDKLTGYFARWSGGRWVDSSSGTFVSNAAAALPLYSTTENERILRSEQKVNLQGWGHRFAFIVSTDETLNGFQPIGYGIKFRFVRKDE